MTEQIAAFYTADTHEVTEWRVTASTARTWTVERRTPHFTWKRTVRRADIGERFFLTPEEAITAAVATKERELGFAKQRVQNIQTQIGMLKSLYARLEASDAARS
jgi:hypothetical protein